MNLYSVIVTYCFKYMSDIKFSLIIVHCLLLFSLHFNSVIIDSQ